MFLVLINRVFVKPNASCWCAQGLHPRIIAEGFEAAKDKALAVLEEVKVTKEMDRETLVNVARTSLRTKVHTELADLLTEVGHMIMAFMSTA